MNGLYEAVGFDEDVHVDDGHKASKVSTSSMVVGRQLQWML